MKLSTRSLYAVRALFHMAYHAPNDTMSVAHIAEAEGISAGFLDQIFQDLRRAELIGSKRGPNGGYHLERAPRDITLLDIIRAAEGDPVETLRREREAASPDVPPSGIHVAALAWDLVADRIEAELASRTLNDLVEMGEEMLLPRESFEEFIYVI